MKNNRTLILTRKVVERCIDMKKAISAVEVAFGEYALGKAQMPAKVYLDLKEFQGDFRAMPAYIEKAKMCSLKWVNAHTGNAKFNLPAVMGVLILSDPQTGYPLCIMDATYLTAIRTGAAGAVAAKFLARRNSNVVGLVGCGAQARTQLKALRTVFKIKEVQVWGHEASFSKKFIKEMKMPGEKMREVRDVESCVRDCDIIVTTTPAHGPIVKRSWIKKGTHINAIGADAKGKQELDVEILLNAKVVVDDWKQASHGGEINIAVSQGSITEKNIYAQLGEIVCEKKAGRMSNEEITVFDSTGLAIQDTAVAALVYKTALKKKIGKFFDLI